MQVWPSHAFPAAAGPLMTLRLREGAMVPDILATGKFPRGRIYFWREGRERKNANANADTNTNTNWSWFKYLNTNNKKMNKVTINKLPKSRVEMIVEVEAQDFKKFAEKALGEAVKEAVGAVVPEDEPAVVEMSSI